MHVCVCMYIYMGMYVCARHVYTCVYVNICMHVCDRQVYICVHASIIHLYMRVHVVYTCTHAHVYDSTYTLETCLRIFAHVCT